jgi:hypothetical protein
VKAYLSPARYPTVSARSWEAESVLGDQGAAFDADLAAALASFAKDGAFPETVSFAYDLACKPGPEYGGRTTQGDAVDPGCFRAGRGGGSPGAQDDPAEVAPGGHQLDGLGDLFEREVDVLRIQPAGGEQVP